MRRWGWLAVVLVCGCTKNGGEVVGTWSSTRHETHSVYHFFKDGKFRSEVQYEMTFVQTTGTWSMKNNWLDIQNTWSDVQGPDAAFVSAVKAKSLDPISTPVRWNSPHNFQINIPGDIEPLIFARMAPNP
jgi:hypothetical protein